MNRFIFILVAVLMSHVTYAQDSLNVSRIWQMEAEAADVVVAGHFAYIASGEAGLRILDIADSTHPVQVALFDTPQWATGVAISGNYAYVADQSSLRIINIANPAAPVEVGFLDYLTMASYVVIHSNYAYVSDNAFGLIIINVSNPAAPTATGFFDAPDYSWGLTVRDNYAYLACGFDGLRIVNISNPVAPTETGFIDTPGQAFGVAVSGNYAFVADGPEGLLRVIDITNLAAPTEIGTYDTPGNLYGVTVSGNYAYVAGGGIRIVDITDPAAVIETGYYNTSSLFMRVVVAGSLAYVADQNYFGIYDCSAAVPVSPIREGFVGDSYELQTAYPNPFNPSTTITFDLPKREHVTLRVFDLLGQEVAVLSNGIVESGTHQLTFDGCNLTSGTYFATLKAGDFTQTRKLMLLK